MQVRRFLHLKVLISKCRDRTSPDSIITSRNESHLQSSMIKQTCRRPCIPQTTSSRNSFSFDEISVRLLSSDYQQHHIRGQPLGWMKSSLNNSPCHRLSWLNELHDINQPHHMASKLLYISPILRYRYNDKIFDLTVNEIEMVHLKKIPLRLDFRNICAPIEDIGPGPEPLHRSDVFRKKS